MDVWDGVQWAVQQAEALSPRRSVFAEHMAAVRTTAAERNSVAGRRGRRNGCPLPQPQAHRHGGHAEQLAHA